jgi:hypothetical protein
MSDLPPDESSIAAAGADPGRRKAAAHEARGVQTFAVTSAPAATPRAEVCVYYSSDVEASCLWDCYTAAVDRLERTGMDADRELARAAWARWLDAYLPDEAQQRVLPVPVIIRGGL